MPVSIANNMVANSLIRKTSTDDAYSGTTLTKTNKKIVTAALKNSRIYRSLVFTIVSPFG